MFTFEVAYHNSSSVDPCAFAKVIVKKMSGSFLFGHGVYFFRELHAFILCFICMFYVLLVGVIKNDDDDDDDDKVCIVLRQ